MNPAGVSTKRVPLDEPILEPLMIPPAMVVLDEFCERPAEVTLAQRNHSIEAFFLDRPHESLGVSIRIRGARWCQDRADAGGAKPLTHRTAPLPIPIAGQHTMSHQHAVICRRRETHDLAHEQGLAKVVDAESTEGLADLLQSLVNQYDLWFDKTTFFKMFEDARGTNWGRQQQTMTVQLPFPIPSAPQPPGQP
jgi:hypothetical protein